jgi:hypothetical protein
MTTIEWIFLSCAIAGGAVFVLRLVLLMFGASVDHPDLAVTHEVGGGDADHGFKLLSLQGVTAFLLMFGLTGFVMLRNFGARPGWAVAGGTGAGCVMLFLVAWIFRSFMKLQSSGTLNLQNAVGQEGTVYLRIPAGGTGKIQVPVQGRLLTLDAVSDAKEEIKSGTRVKVEAVVAGELLKVGKS